jgi:sigma-B regulation protein RsbU (phosphoserine phosphatase)
MVLYSDGVTEAANHAEEFYGDDRLAAALSGVVGLEDAAATASISQGVRAFAAGHHQSDDITIVGVRRR